MKITLQQIKKRTTRCETQEKKQTLKNNQTISRKMRVENPGNQLHDVPKDQEDMTFIKQQALMKNRVK